VKDLIGRLSRQLGLDRARVERTTRLFDDDNTIPFVARYRKEMTGGLDEVQLAEFRERLDALRRLDDRQKTVLRSIEEQGKLTPDLAEAIEEAESLQQVEDLYLPYKPRRRTRAQMARERGLEPVAGWILDQEVFDPSMRDEAVEPYLSPEVETADEAWQGARDIVAEVIAEDARCREAARQLTWNRGSLSVAVAAPDDDPKRTYETYYAFDRGLRDLKPHQVLAINRGEEEGVLRVAVDVYDEPILRAIGRLYTPDDASPLANDLDLAARDAYQRLIGPAIEREVRRDLKERADEHAIDVFATNLRNLLLVPPISGHVVLGVDPGFRTGCKLAVVDETGQVLATGTIYPHPPQREWEAALDTLDRLITQHEVSLIAVGNGTASRETEELAAVLIERIEARGGREVRYLITSETGASVYSASPLAREELPDLDVSLRGAASIARRVQDPLAEFVKIDPRSIGVGMYQHDVDQTALADALAWVTESVVNAVGVDVNTASPALLQYVAGLGPTLAGRIVAHRNQHGPFPARETLRRVKGIGAKTFEQAAGFLRVPGGENLLDNTGVHPESYPAVARLLDLAGIDMNDRDFPQQIRELEEAWDAQELAPELGIGEATLRDILAELKRPGRDPRADAPPPILRRDVLTMEDLRPGMRLRGTVRNVVDFGAFVDVGVKQDGLVHISEMANERVDSPYDVVGVGDVIEVTVLNVDIDRGRIALSMR
jgi:uncharacterized protein